MNKILQLFAFPDAFTKEQLGICCPEKVRLDKSLNSYASYSTVCWVEQILREKVKNGLQDRVYKLI